MFAIDAVPDLTTPWVTMIAAIAGALIVLGNTALAIIKAWSDYNAQTLAATRAEEVKKTLTANTAETHEKMTSLADATETNSKKIDAIHDATNGMKADLVAAVKVAAHAEGMQDQAALTGTIVQPPTIKETRP